MLPQKILKIMYPRLDKIAFHGISALDKWCFTPHLDKSSLNAVEFKS